MSIAINNNLMALNTANTLQSHYGRLSTSVERLSSGLRINSAADDAAGLAIRELMRADVAALNQGMRNANDAISMIQVADGALAIIDEKLIRMKELAEQAATGTYSSTQRLMIDSEYQAMASEIDRIARATDFNGIKLLDGSLSGKHNGNGLNATGSMKIHFGTANDSAEDYYYVQIGDCTAAALGVGAGAQSLLQTGTWIKQETVVRETVTYKPTTSYKEYIDPATNKTYYGNGGSFVADMDNPAGTLLDAAQDREIIARLREVQDSMTMYDNYWECLDQVTGATYYRSGNGTYVSNMDDPVGSRLNPNNQTDKDIIDRLVETNKYYRHTTIWQIYEDPSGTEYYSKDNGISFCRSYFYPVTMDANDPANKKIIESLKPKLKVNEVKLPTVAVDYIGYIDPQTSRRYFTCDNGKTFVGNVNKPSESALDPVNDKDILNRLQIDYKIVTGGPRYNVYRDKTSGEKFYTCDNGATFVKNVYKPDEIALRKDDPAHAAALANLEVVPYTTTGSTTCDIYEDLSDNNKKYYSKDNGKTFFSDLQDPSGSAFDVNDPAHASMNLQKINSTIQISTTFEVYRLGSTWYYTADGGKTFVLDVKKGEEIALDASNANDKTVIDQLQPHQSATVAYDNYFVYEDPVTGTTYYTLKDGPQEKFILNLSQPNVALDKNNPADEAIIKRLKQAQATATGSVESSFPDVYYIYEDSRNGNVYYSVDDGKTFTSNASDPYNSNYQLDPNKASDKLIIDNLRAKSTEVIKETLVWESGGSQMGPAAGATISTQDAAQRALVAIDRAIVSKDQIRAHLGAMQNRLENTVTNLNIQAENMQNAESRISDADVAYEMTNFVRSQILTQSAVAMLGQANTYPHMLLNLISG